MSTDEDATELTKQVRDHRVSDCQNHEFARSLNDRKKQPVRNIVNENKEMLKSMQSGKPPQERLIVPDGVEQFMYGNQKLNVWEWQKEQLRKQVEQDPSNFYTYSKEHLSLAFPLVNENQIKAKEKEENEAKWKTQYGFDNVTTKTKHNEHPKKPPQSIIDDLQIPYVEQMKDQKQKLKATIYKPEDDGKQDFQSKVKSQGSTFSDPSYFKTVFISGDDMVKEMQELKQKEIDDFNSKVVVANTHFKVNTRDKHSNQLDKHKSIREDPVKKVGLRLGQSKIRNLVARQIITNKSLDEVPVTVFANEKYVPKDTYVPQKSLMIGKSL